MCNIIAYLQKSLSLKKCSTNRTTKKIIHTTILIIKDDKIVSFPSMINSYCSSAIILLSLLLDFYLCCCMIFLYCIIINIYDNKK